MGSIDVDCSTSCLQQRVSIIGAGPAGFALAADLESHGTHVLVYSHPAHARHAEEVVRRGCLKASGLIEGCFFPRVTFDMAETVHFSDIIVLTVPSTGQETILRELRDFDLRGHTVVAIPGNLFTLIAEAAGAEVGRIFEINLSPYSCRMNEGELRVLGRKSLVSIGTNHPDAGGGGDGIGIERVFPDMRLKWCSNVVEVSLSNINAVFHPLMTLMNAGRIESTHGDFLIYRDGLTPSVARAMLAVDTVRVQIGAALGFSLRGVLETSNECYGHGFGDLVDLARNSGPHRHLRAPADIANRNVSEDVPNLLVTWHGLAEQLGIDAAPVAAVVVLAGLATGVDYMKTGRNLRKLELDGLARSELVQRFGVSRSFK